MSFIVMHSFKLKEYTENKQVLRHFWGSSCFKANKFIAQQGNACPVEHLSFDSFNFIDCPFQHSIIQIDIHRILDSQLVSLYACGKFS